MSNKKERTEVDNTNWSGNFEEHKQILGMPRIETLYVFERFWNIINYYSEIEYSQNRNYEDSIITIIQKHYLLIFFM